MPGPQYSPVVCRKANVKCDLISMYKCLLGVFKDRARLFSIVYCDRTGQEAVGTSEIQEILFEHKKKMLYCKGDQWNSLPSKAGESPFLEVIKTCLDRVLGNL